MTKFRDLRLVATWLLHGWGMGSNKSLCKGSCGLVRGNPCIYKYFFMDVLLIGAKHNICFIVAVVIIFAYIYISIYLSTRIKSTYNQDKTYRNIEQYIYIMFISAHIINDHTYQDILMIS